MTDTEHQRRAEVIRSRQRWHSLQFLCALLIIAISACSNENADKSPGLDEPVPEDTQDTITGTVTNQAGRWRKEPNLAALASTKDDPGIELDIPEISEDVVQPVIESRGDLVLYVSGELNSNMGRSAFARTLQVVPGLPEEDPYSGTAYEAIRRAFTTDCLTHAAGYRANLLTLLDQNDLRSNLMSQLTRSSSSEYEQHCFAPIETVPQAIKQVVGIFTHYDVPFCSGTVVSQDRVLTSKHCFVTAEGQPQPTLGGITTGNIAFLSLAPNGGHEKFSMISIGEIAVTPFMPYEDAIEVRSYSEQFSQFARSADVSDLTLPLPIWLVGGNGLIGDASTSSHVLGFIRASGPKACAILNSTDSGCLYHSCQTSRLSSGSGLLSMGLDGAVRVLGVHKAPTSLAAGCEPSPPLDLRLNVAARYVVTQ